MAVSPLPRNVEYDGRQGTVVREVYLDQDCGEKIYRKVIQLIEFEDAEDEIRFGYYLKGKGTSDDDFYWGSQTTLMLPKDMATKLIDLARKDGIL